MLPWGDIIYLDKTVLGDLFERSPHDLCLVTADLAKRCRRNPNKDTLCDLTRFVAKGLNDETCVYTVRAVSSIRRVP